MLECQYANLQGSAQRAEISDGFLKTWKNKKIKILCYFILLQYFRGMYLTITSLYCGIADLA